MNATEQNNDGQTVKEAESNALVLPSVLDISSAEALFTLLKEAVSVGNISLNATNVEKLTTPCIQLFLAAEKTLSLRGGRLTVTSPSGPFKTAMADLGFTEQLEQWSNA